MVQGRARLGIERDGENERKEPVEQRSEAYVLEGASRRGRRAAGGNKMESRDGRSERRDARLGDTCAVVQVVRTPLDVRSCDISTALKGLHRLAAAGAAAGGRDGSQPFLSSSLRVFQYSRDNLDEGSRHGKRGHVHVTSTHHH